MKHGKNPTVNQKKAIEQIGLNSDDWLVVRVLSKTKTLELKHRELNEFRTIKDTR